MQELLAAGGIMLAIFLLTFGMYLLVSFILAYVFGAIGTYRLMTKRNIPNAFLAWIPIANEYALGNVYDDIVKKEKDAKDPKFRIIMLVVALGYFVFGTRIQITIPSSVNSMTTYATSDLFSSLAGIAFIALIVLYLICLKKIFEVYAPNNTSYFALSVVFSILFLLAPFVPALCLLKASRNDPADASKAQPDR